MRHVELAGMFDAEMIRIAVGAENEGYDTDCGHLAETFRHVLRGCDDKLTFGIENHFDITTEEIVKVVELVDDRRLGTVFDTTNAIHLLERPEETLAKMLSLCEICASQGFPYGKGRGFHYDERHNLGPGYAGHESDPEDGRGKMPPRLHDRGADGPAGYRCGA